MTETTSEETSIAAVIDVIRAYRDSIADGTFGAQGSMLVSDARDFLTEIIEDLHKINSYLEQSSYD